MEGTNMWPDCCNCQYDKMQNLRGKYEYLLVSSFPYVLPHKTTQLPLDTFLGNFMLGGSYQNLSTKFKFGYNRNKTLAASHEDLRELITTPVTRVAMVTVDSQR